MPVVLHAIPSRSGSLVYLIFCLPILRCNFIFSWTIKYFVVENILYRSIVYSLYKYTIYILHMYSIIWNTLCLQQMYLLDGIYAINTLLMALFIVIILIHLFYAWSPVALFKRFMGFLHHRHVLLKTKNVMELKMGPNLNHFSGCKCWNYVVNVVISMIMMTNDDYHTIQLRMPIKQFIILHFVH